MNDEFNEEASGNEKTTLVMGVIGSALVVLVLVGILASIIIDMAVK